MKRLIVLLAASLFSVLGFAQNLSSDIDFINYLVGNNMSREAAVFLEKNSYAPSDTLSYLKGYTLYSAGNLERAAAEFSKVSPTSEFFEKSVLFGGVCHAYLKNYSDGLSLIRSSREDSELSSYALASFSLLCDDKASYEQARTAFTFSDYALVEGEKRMEEIYQSRFVDKQKSPWLAAAASAIVPGLGKVYAGRVDEAIPAFLTVGILAGFTAENWIKNGPTDWRTIVFGTLGSLFYIGNIYGSYVSVGIQNDNLRDAQNNTIVFNLHVPIRNIYNQ